MFGDAVAHDRSSKIRIVYHWEVHTWLYISKTMADRTTITVVIAYGQPIGDFTFDLLTNSKGPDRGQSTFRLGISLTVSDREIIIEAIEYEVIYWV